MADGVKDVQPNNLTVTFNNQPKEEIDVKITVEEDEC